MNRHMARGLLACATLIVVLSAPAVARADVIGDWNATAQAEAVLIRPTAHGQARGMAMVQGAVYDAVNAVVRTHQPYLLDLKKVDVQPFASQDAAAATAAHHVLVKIVAPERVAALDTAYQATLTGIPDGPIEQEGIKAGEAAAQAMLDARKDDGYMAAFTPTIGTNPGNWRPIGWPATPAFDPDGWVGNLKPFVIESPSQFRSDGPNALTSAEYAKDYNEVKELGALNSTKRTADQTTAAVFWQFPPAALYNRLARELSRTEPLRPRHLQAGSPLRDGEPRDGRRRDQLLERQVPLGVLAAAGGDPRGRDRRERRRRSAIPRGSRSSTRRRAPGWRRRRSPTTRRGTAASAARSCGRSGSSSGRTRSRSTSARAGSRTSHGTSSGSRSR